MGCGVCTFYPLLLHICVIHMSILNKIDKNCSCKHDIQQSEQTLLAVFLKSRKFYFPFLICSITFKIQIVGGNYTQKSGVHIPTPESHFFVFFSFNFQILLKNLNLFCLTTFDYLFFQKLNKTCWKYICLPWYLTCKTRY